MVVVVDVMIEMIEDNHGMSDLVPVHPEEGQEVEVDHQGVEKVDQEVAADHLMVKIENEVSAQEDNREADQILEVRQAAMDAIIAEARAEAVPEQIDLTFMPCFNRPFYT